MSTRDCLIMKLAVARRPSRELKSVPSVPVGVGRHLVRTAACWGQLWRLWSVVTGPRPTGQSSGLLCPLFFTVEIDPNGKVHCRTWTRRKSVTNAKLSPFFAGGHGRVKQSSNKNKIWKKLNKPETNASCYSSRHISFLRKRLSSWTSLFCVL